MSIVRHDDLVRQALTYILETAAEAPDTPLPKLLDDAGMRFNLSPLDAEKLSNLLAENRRAMQCGAASVTPNDRGARP